MNIDPKFWFTDAIKMHESGMSYGCIGNFFNVPEEKIKLICETSKSISLFDWHDDAREKRETHTLKEICELFDISYGYASKICKGITGPRVKKNSNLRSNARMLRETTNLSLNKIAQRLKSDPAYIWEITKDIEHPNQKRYPSNSANSIFSRKA